MSFSVHFASQPMFHQVTISGVPKGCFSKRVPIYLITKYTKAGEINPGVAAS